MAIQLSVAVRNGRLNAIPTTVGVSPILKMWTGSMPANCAAADTGTQLVHITLPTPYLNAASGGQITLSGTWNEIGADASGTAGYFRVYDPTGTTCHIQGTITATGSGGDLTLDNVTMNSGQSVTVTSFTLTDANA